MREISLHDFTISPPDLYCFYLNILDEIFQNVLDHDDAKRLTNGIGEDTAMTHMSSAKNIQI